jgi:hypothetical protein
MAVGAFLCTGDSTNRRKNVVSKFAKGNKLAGSRKGRPNKSTASIKDAFVQAFDRLGGVDALVKWGKTNPTEFYKQVTKLIPVEVTGKDGADLVQTVKVLIVDGKEK